MTQEMSNQMSKKSNNLYTSEEHVYKSRESIHLPHSDEAAAHMYPSDLKKFEVGGEHTATAFSVAVGCPEELSQPLYTLDQIRAAIEADRQQQRGEPITPWRAHEAVIDAKALATAQEIALMWGEDRSQFVSRIQLAVLDSMKWILTAQHHRAAYEEGWNDALQWNNPRYRRQVRNEALDEAAKAVANHNLQGREWVRGSLFDTLANEAAARIRQLKSEPLKD